MAVNGKRGRIQGPTEFVISGVMLFNCLSPPWQSVICASERFLWLLSPLLGLSVSISQAPPAGDPLNF